MDHTENTILVSVRIRAIAYRPASSSRTTCVWVTRRVLAPGPLPFAAASPADRLRKTPPMPTILNFRDRLFWISIPNTTPIRRATRKIEWA
ncbi:hypothetical protein GWI33_015102 [Rhynchophorus ferrugineus]|uniref:Uncharacterized protein n=1 Tax=Rhynchophorus ferrugineus TaxID=354439 RepID=A0A834M6A3_RHYFE|nr:hypothetical protein GWI33_015102 [Rhynchophorus ferrugineus]